ncbi:MAG: hypothetical protein IAG13_35560 [Deltaproteobacteria bacterium]|nr:hypothetical protein [Nannocystaceae bacterium]
MINTKLIRSGVTLALCAPMFGGCLLTVGSEDDDDSASDTDDIPSDTSFSSDDDDDDDDGNDDESSSVGDDGNSDDGSDGGTTEGPVGECSETRIVDGGFEAGTPSTAWTEASEQFGSPICDVGCTEEEGAAPYAGEWFAWFGGVADAEQASVSQSVTLDGATAFLSFRFQINAGAGTGDDVFTVTIDGDPVFMATDLEIEDYAGYTPLSIDVSDFVGEGEHVVEFRSDHLGTGMSSFFLDEVALVTCDESGESSSSGDDGTTAADDSSGDDSSDGSSSDGSSSDGSSSDGSSGDSDSSSTGS